MIPMLCVPLTSWPVCGVDSPRQAGGVCRPLPEGLDHGRAQRQRGAAASQEVLTPEQKYEVAMLRGDATQRELADGCGVDRAVVIKVSEVAKHSGLSVLAASKPGRSGTHDPQADELRGGA